MTSSPSAAFWPAATALWRREIVRFYRQPSRVVGALSSPLIFWIVIGSGMGGSFAPPGANPGDSSYLEFFFPGVLALAVLFTAIMSMISVIEDRDAGFLQGVLAAPAPRSAIAAGKIAGGATLALLQGMLFLVVAPFAGFSLGWEALAGILASLAAMGFGLAGLGFLMAWRMDSIQGFHVVMNTVLMPMWLLSGAPFPASGAGEWMRAVMAVNPMTYGVEALRRSFYLGAEKAYVPQWDLPFAAMAGVMVAFGVATLLLATGQTRRPRVA